MDVSARLSLLRKLALACAVLVLAITTLSAYIRLSRAGLGCAPWPQCYEARAALAPDMLAPLDGPALVRARIAHRIAASAALLVIVALLVKSLAVQPMLWSAGRLALALLVLALFLAVLGRMAGDSRLPPVVLGNLLAGFALFALACRLIQATQPSSGEHGVRLRPWVAAALVLLSLQIALGGLASSQHAASSCASAGLCALHRAVGIATAAVLVAIGALAAYGGRRWGVAVMVLALAQVALGTLVAANPSPLAYALGHNVVAALLLATLLALLPPRATPVLS